MGLNKLTSLATRTTTSNPQCNRPVGTSDRRNSNQIIWNRHETLVSGSEIPRVARAKVSMMRGATLQLQLKTSP